MSNLNTPDLTSEPTSPTTTAERALSVAEVDRRNVDTDEYRRYRRGLKRKAARKRFFSAGWLHIVLVAMAFTLALPFVWMVLTSLKHLSQVGVGSWLPTAPAAYKESDVRDPEALYRTILQDPTLRSMPIDAPPEEPGREQQTLGDVTERLPAPPWQPDQVDRARRSLTTALTNAVTIAGSRGVTLLEGMSLDLPDKARERRDSIAELEAALAEARQKLSPAAADAEREAGAEGGERDIDEAQGAAREARSPAAMAEEADAISAAQLERAARDIEVELERERSLLQRYRVDAAFGSDLLRPTRALQWENYADVFTSIPFGRYYVNSIFISCWVTFLQVFTSSLAAFAFARLTWPGRDKVFLLYLATMMLPGLVMMIPNYQIMITLGLVDTMTGLILPAAFTAFGTFLLRQFMLSIPSAMDEAAAIDGASTWRTYWDVILPMARPGLITLAIFTFIGSYHSFFWPLVMLKSEHKYTLPIGLLFFESSAGQETNLLLAAVTMSVVPMIIVFVTLQKYLVKGIQLGAVKG